jgi:hypothetical protein
VASPRVIENVYPDSCPSVPTNTRTSASDFEGIGADVLAKGDALLGTDVVPRGAH